MENIVNEFAVARPKTHHMMAQIRVLVFQFKVNNEKRPTKALRLQPLRILNAPGLTGQQVAIGMYNVCVGRYQVKRHSVAMATHRNRSVARQSNALDGCISFRVSPKS